MEIMEEESYLDEEDSKPKKIKKKTKRIRTKVKSEKKKIHSCELCEYSTTIKQSLKTHIDVIHNKVRVYCDLCDVSTSTMSRDVYKLK